MKKQIIASLIACSLIGGAYTVNYQQDLSVGITANALTDDDGNEYTEGTQGSLTYKKYSDHIEISKCDRETKGEINIPETIEGLPVTSIGEGAFYDSHLEKVTLPDGVTAIGSLAFAYSTIQEVTIPDSVTEIGSHAFSYNGIKNVVLPKSLKKIEYCLFGRSPLETVEIPDSVETIEAEAFAYTSLKSVKLPEGLKYLGDYAFSCCDDLTEINIPKSLTTINHFVFAGSKSLKSIKLHNGITSIGNWGFFGTSLTTIDISENVTEIGAGAFAIVNLLNR